MRTIHSFIGGARLIALLALLVSSPASLASVPVDKVSAQAFVDLQQGHNMPAGFRRAHAKGLCVSGAFYPSGALQPYTTAKVLNAGQWPFVGRFSIAGNNPTAPDLKAPVRSLALSFVASANDQWRVAMNTPPVMAVADPHTFYQQIQAIKAGPNAIAQFFADHPESRDFLAWKKSYQPSQSFADEIYHSINAFYLINESGQQQPVRWRLVPVTTAVAITTGQGEDALQQELAQRLAKGAVAFDWLFTLAAPEDDENNPAIMWPAQRKTVNAGRLLITGWQVSAMPSITTRWYCRAVLVLPLTLF
jgi:catalase